MQPPLTRGVFTMGRLDDMQAAAGERVTRAARASLETQVAAGETVVLSTPLAASALLLTDKRLMVAPAIRGAEPEINVPLRAVNNVTWQKGMLGSAGTLTVATGSGVHRYKARNHQGEPIVVAIRRAMTGI